MCGVVGIFSDNDLNLRSIDPMIHKLNHRGPDDSGKFLSNNKKLALGHSRLSIIDLSKNGKQPMTSHSSRYVISYNGEIYNFMNLRNELRKSNPSIQFFGNSDTEVLLNYIEVYGVQKTLNTVKGMFSFALWDKKDKKLTLARDIAGEKPLYYGYIKGNLYFASEPKAIKAKVKDLTVCQKSMRLMLKYNCIPAPYSIYEKKAEGAKPRNQR